MSRDDGQGANVPDERKRAFGERYQPRYSGVATFMRRPLREPPAQWDGIDIGIVGVPFDGGVTNRPGARHGPRHLRDQSTLMGVVIHQTGVRPYELAEVADLGDVLIEGVYRLDEAIADIERYYDGVAAAGIVPLTAGGDHSITLPIMRALARAHGGPLGLIHFDAHCDTGPELFGHKHHHGGPFKVAVEDGALDPKRTIQIGIRGPAEPLWGFSYESGMTVIHIEDLYAMGISGGGGEGARGRGRRAGVRELRRGRARPGVSRPAPGTPEVGGFTTYEAQQMLRGLRGLDIVAGDVVEVSPALRPVGHDRADRRPDDVRDPVPARGDGGKEEGGLSHAHPCSVCELARSIGPKTHGFPPARE